MFIRGLELGLLTDGNHQFPKPAPDEQPMEQSHLAASPCFEAASPAQASSGPIRLAAIILLLAANRARLGACLTEGPDWRSPDFGSAERPNQIGPMKTGPSKSVTTKPSLANRKIQITR